MTQRKRIVFDVGMTGEKRRILPGDVHDPTQHKSMVFQLKRVTHFIQTFVTLNLRTNALWKMHIGRICQRNEYRLRFYINVKKRIYFSSLFRIQISVFVLTKLPAPFIKKKIIGIFRCTLYTSPTISKKTQTFFYQILVFGQSFVVVFSQWPF